MERSPAAAALIAEVEQRSGFPVQLLHDPAIGGKATIRRATGSQSAHLLRYRQEDALTDYFIAYQCGLLLRGLAEDPEPPRQLAEGRERRRWVIEQVAALNPQLSSAQAQQAGGGMYDGLMVQLRSVPPGLLVDRRLHRDWPSLHQAQRQAMEEEIRSGLPVLSPAFGQGIPEELKAANRAMNCAYALTAAELFAAPDLAVPYQAAGLAGMGKELVALAVAAEESGQRDWQLIDAWAEKIGLQGWYGWLEP